MNAREPGSKAMTLLSLLGHQVNSSKYMHQYIGSWAIDAIVDTAGLCCHSKLPFLVSFFGLIVMVI
jgi:CO dehydrogenase/acetyl-CoA synthase alpha subunit